MDIVFETHVRIARNVYLTLHVRARDPQEAAEKAYLAVVDLVDGRAKPGLPVNVSWNPLMPNEPNLPIDT